MAPRTYLPATTYGYEERFDERPCLTLTDTDISKAFTNAEPSRLMTGVSRFYARTMFIVKASLLIGLIGFYPYLVVRGHQIDDTRVQFAAGQDWNAGSAGVSVMLIAREIEGAGWVADRPGWHPQSRLTALPAWQAASMSAVSDYTDLTVRLAGGDDDLGAAARLLVPQADRNNRARLIAAAQAFARYDGRVEQHLADVPEDKEALAARLKLAAGWGVASRAELASQASASSKWPADKPAIESFYTAKARAHVSHELLSVAVEDYAGMLIDAGLDEDARTALAHWQRAGSQSPLFVSNQSGETYFQPNHLAEMAFYIDEAVTASTSLAALIEAYDPSQSPATDIAMLVTSP